MNIWMVLFLFINFINCFSADKVTKPIDKEQKKTNIVDSVICVRCKLRFYDIDAYNKHLREVHKIY
jgi:hypothetical protein